MSLDKLELPGGAMSGLVAKAVEYMVDAGQRSVLFFDIMRQRGDQYREHIAQTAPNVLSYAAELIIDGQMLKQPVNYALVRIIPPKGVEIDLERRPFIVVAPRAGHGPGIGGLGGTGMTGCCGGVATGHVAAAPPRSVMNSRHCMCPLRTRLVQWLKPSTLRMGRE